MRPKSRPEGLKAQSPEEVRRAGGTEDERRVRVGVYEWASKSGRVRVGVYEWASTSGRVRVGVYVWRRSDQYGGARL